MSLLQTIARLRRRSEPSAGDPALLGAPTAFPVSSTPVGDADMVRPTKKLVTVDTDAIRRAGYLPGASKVRQFADHYRHIKRPLIDKMLTADAADAAKLRLIMVTSALPGDGKTFSSINLALSMARERDFSVLLIDADVYKRQLSAIFGVDNRLGLLDALVYRSIDVESLILPVNVRGANVRGLSILPVGKFVENATELISSARMVQIARAISESNPLRRSLFDAPPLLVSSEARALTKIAGQVVLVVSAGRTPRHAVLDAINYLDRKKPIGLVLNKGKFGLTEDYGYGEYGTDGDEKKSQR